VTPVLVVILRNVESVVDAGDKDKEPREDSQGLVDPDALLRVRFTSCKRIDWCG